METNINNPEKVAQYLTTQLEGLKIDHPLVKDIRGKGLNKILCLWEEYEGRVISYSTILEERLINRKVPAEVDNYIVKLTLPLTTTTSEIDEIVHAIDLTLWGFEGSLGISRFA